MSPQNPRKRFSKLSLDCCLSKAHYPNGLREIADGDKADQNQAGRASEKRGSRPPATS